MSQDEVVAKAAVSRHIASFGDFLTAYSSFGHGLTNGQAEAQPSVGVVRVADEKLGLEALTQSDNRSVGKVVLTLTSLAEELRRLQDEAKTELLLPLLIFEKMHNHQTDLQSALAMSRLLPHLERIACFTEHCRDTIENLINQLAGMSEPRSSVVKLGINNLSVLWLAVGDLLVEIAGLDLALRADMIQSGWSLYKKLVRSVRHEPEKYGKSPQQFRHLEKSLIQLEDHVIPGKLLAFTTGKVKSAIPSKQVLDDLTNTVRNLLNNAESNGPESRRQLLTSVCLTVMLIQLARQPDRKLISRMSDVIKKLGTGFFVFNSGLLWEAKQFFFDMSDVFLENNQLQKNLTSLDASRVSWMTSKLTDVSSEIKILKDKSTQWAINLKSLSRKPLSELSLNDLSERAELCLVGKRIIAATLYTTKNILVVFQEFGQPLTTTALLSMGHALEVAMIIKEQLLSYNSYFNDILERSIQHSQYLVLNMIQQGKKGVVSERKYSDTKLDLLTCLILLEKSLIGTGNNERRQLAAVTFGLVTSGAGRTIFKDSEMKTLQEQLRRMSEMINFWDCLEEDSSTLFLSWNTALLPNIFEDIYGNVKPWRLAPVLRAYESCGTWLDWAKHEDLSSKANLIKEYQSSVVELLEGVIVTRLCSDIETELRLVVHHKHGLQLGDRNPISSPSTDLKPFIQLKPIRFLNTQIHLRAYCEEHLDRTFYQLTTVSLHNWRTYREMRHLALVRLGLHTVEDHLPPQTLEQGLDLLEIMRNIAVFTQGYAYNMNSQNFVERSSNNKHLNTVNVRHIANSIRTHGFGVLNTTVNFTYQFLKKHLAIFSQFLYDEHIKSRLLKDATFLSENAQQLDKKYPFQRAVKFNRGVRRLGLMPDGVSTYLDKFRELVTAIGNSMGFVRMVRSGSLMCTNDAVRYLPHVEEGMSFVELFENEDGCPPIGDSGQLADLTMQTAISNFSSHNVYYSLLVGAFRGQLSAHAHLDSFYLIIPPLTLNFIEHILADKEKINKNNQDGAVFTDDGFALGLAFCLEVLGQWDRLDSLHWQDSVMDHLAEERDKVTRQLAGEKEERLKSTLVLTLRRMDNTIREFHLMHYSLASARIFFQENSENEK